MARREVILRSTEPSAVEAVRSTLRPRRYPREGGVAVASETPIKDKLKEHVDKLHILLADGNPGAGMMTWQMFVNSHWKAIVDHWNANASDTGGTTKSE